MGQHKPNMFIKWIKIPYLNTTYLLNESVVLSYLSNFIKMKKKIMKKKKTNKYFNIKFKIKE